MKFKIKFSGKSHNYTEEEIETVVQAMKDAEPYTQGRYQKEFEKKFCEYIGASHAFAVNNATSALEMAAQLCEFEPGDEVIIPSHTFTSSAYPFAKKVPKSYGRISIFKHAWLRPKPLKKKLVHIPRPWL